MNTGRWYANNLHEYIYVAVQRGYDRWDTIWFPENGSYKYWPAVELDDKQWHDYKGDEWSCRRAVMAVFV
jgi:hypothetical protein